MKGLSFLCAAVFVLLALAGANASGASDPATPGHTAVLGLDFEPPCLNVLLAGCGNATAEWTAGSALAGAFRRLPDSTYEPMLVDGVDVELQPFALTYRIEADAVWSDGTPVSADDFLFTLETILDPQNAIASRAGYDLVTQATKVGPKTVRFEFGAAYAAWRSLFPHVLPTHVLAGRDFDQVWRDEIADPVLHTPIGSGPFLVTDWTKGTSLTLSRNPRWWGASGPILDAVQFRFIPNTNTQFQALRAGELDVIFPQPQLQLAELRADPRFAVQAAPGTTLEHLDFNVGSTTMPLLREPWFRQAVAYAIDRDAVADHVWSSLVPGYQPQHNLSVMSAQPEYVPSFARYSFDPTAVAGLMTSHGCALGVDGIWSCGGVRASVKLATTTGNALREQAQQDLQTQARAAGIELVPDNSTTSVLLVTRLPARQYELIMFAWILGGGSATALERYGCSGASNFLDYCSGVVTELLQQAEAEVDPVASAELVNQADAILAQDVPSIPLFLRPQFLARWASLSGPEVNPAGSATWNIESWHQGAADTVAPSTTALAAPAATVQGWHNTTVTVELAADDGPGSGIHALHYSLSGAQTGGESVPGSAATVTVSAEGVTTLTYFARDRFGNVEPPQTLTIRIDRVAPAISCEPDPATLWPPNRRLVPVAVDVDVTDARSGAGGFTLLSVAGGDPSDVDGFAVGTADAAGSLRAELGRRGARSYTLVYEGADQAGNTTRCTADVAVRRGG